jgi:hypothetical protein
MSYESALQLTPMCCGNCTHWHPVTRNGTVGECEHPDNAYFVESSGSYTGPMMVDLAMCTKWTKIDADEVTGV